MRMGPPPVPGKPVTTGKSVADCVELPRVDCGVSVGACGVSVDVEFPARVVAVLVDVLVDVLVACAAAQTTGVTWLVSSVTAAFRARALPARLAPVFMVMLATARIFPTNEVVVPTVAELPTCQNKLQP